VSKDKKRGMEYHVKAANGGHWPARVAIAHLIMEGEAFRRDDAQIVRWLKPVAERQPDQFDTNQRHIIATAQVMIGAVYYHGKNNVPRDHNQAFYWFEKAAQGGDLVGQRNYGQMLRDRNRHAEAVTWLREAATRGDRAAQNDLGMMYFNGWGVAKSEEDAIAWLLRAYQQGSPTAKDSLRKLGVDAK
jgi:TPR repeat protein